MLRFRSGSIRETMVHSDDKLLRQVLLHMYGVAKFSFPIQNANFTGSDRRKLSRPKKQNFQNKSEVSPNT